jgi:hypothetical protein
MPVTRKLVAQDDNDDNQWLLVDHSSRYIVNDMDDWQFLFGPYSTLSSSSRVIKIAAQLDTNTLDKIRLVAYLYNPTNGSIDSAASTTFNIYLVQDITTPKWDDLLITTQSGILQSNGYFFKDVLISSLTGTSLDGDTTLMIEAAAIRNGITFRDRIYVNHLGVYDSILRLRSDVEFLDLTKVDE